MKKKFRTSDAEKTYREYLKNNTDRIPFSDWTETIIKEYIYWVVVKNQFPYDIIAQKHHLLIPRRVFASDHDMNADERHELTGIKKELLNSYDMYIENCNTLRSVASHFHIHLIEILDETSSDY